MHTERWDLLPNHLASAGLAGRFPFGIAVDSTLKRIYVSDGIHNRIGVYSTSGTLLHIIN